MNVTVDVVVYRKKENSIEILLIKRKNDPYKNKWALPGGFVEETESLEEAAKRELKEETGLSIKNPEQVHTFGDPGRDPRGRTISVAFMSWVDAGDNATASDDAAEVQWFPATRLPELAFDHSKIISHAMKKTRN